jgi:aminoglycoside 6'-N-acetyltransferase
LRPGNGDDLFRLVSILREPDVARRWGKPAQAEIREDFIDTESGFVIEVEGDVVGAIQYDENDTPMYESAGIDLFITTPRHGQGFGTDAVRTLARYLIEERGHHRITIDPAADNAAAIRCYGKVGFRPAGVMRAYERGPDGAWHDGLLMDLLAGELVES